MSKNDISGNDPTGNKRILIQTDLIKAETEKIDNLAVDGLVGVANSLAYKVEEIERHLHNTERWLGLAAVPDAELHRADSMAGGIAPFRLTAGNDDFGAWVQILGSDDTPIVAGKVKIDGHRFLVSSTDSTNPFIIQFVVGESADIAAKIVAGDFTETPYVSGSNNNDSGISDLLSRRADVGSKVWARCACIGSNGSVIDLYLGVHEYEG